MTAIGGLPTGFDGTPLPEETLAAIEALYQGAGGQFLLLANRSRYPRSAFFDTPEHLNEPAQIVHSRLLAQALAAVRIAARE